ncbi:Ycf66 family protein [Synechococcus sp. CCY 9618]|uniref:Ycf66 family protein n=1 Tax=Synechococcus sp. CCY 9618 TaxID=2815602 RepID=UPI001C21B8DF
MVNASLNWASIVGIVLAVGGAFLYFMRSFKPALARDYDVFFAAIGLLCGGILFFQGWRLDPILQFGQFLLAGTTVFFAYESVRLRGVTTEQARRSSYFDDEEPAAPFRPRGGLGGGRSWEDEPDRFDEPEPLRRRIPSREEPEDDFYRPRRPSRAAIPERAASRRDEPETWDSPRRERPSGRPERDVPPDDLPGRVAGRYSAGGSGRSQPADFGARRRERDSGPETRRGTRPVASADTLPRSSRRGSTPPGETTPSPRDAAFSSPQGTPMGTPIRSSGRRSETDEVSDADFSPMAGGRPRPPSADARPPAAEPPASRPSARDNSSRFDD